MHIKHLFFLAAALLPMLSQAAATFEGNPNAFETPLGRGSVTDIDSNAVTGRDTNFNRMRIQSPNGGFSATAIGNLINVETNGNNNTVVIYANQTNSGNVRASLDRLGQPD